jgi:hypothetical protein
VGYWHQSIQKLGGTWMRHSTVEPHKLKKPHQALRERLSDYLQPLDAAAEIAQLGHGGGKDVIVEHYLSLYDRRVKIMSDLGLPALSVAGFTWPRPLAAPDGIPMRLHNEFKGIMQRQVHAGFFDRHKQRRPVGP